MYRLLSLHLRTPYAQLKTASEALITRLFETSVLFEHDPKEVAAWIESLPRTKHTNSLASEDDITIFLAFFDDVLSRCVKTPYKYLEQGKQLYSSSSDVSRMPSPLFMTVLEQLRHKPMDPTSRRLVASFLARLVKLLVGKMEVGDAKAISAYMRDVFTKEGEGSPGLKVVSRLEAFLEDLAPAEIAMDMDTGVTSTPTATLFVQEVESMGIDEEKANRAQAIARIVDWVRSLGGELGSPDIVRLLRSLESWSIDRATLRELLEELDFTALSTALLTLADKKETMSLLLDV
jgi:nucleolar pre-ribosomal-associated protein 1